MAHQICMLEHKLLEPSQYKRPPYIASPHLPMGRRPLGGGGGGCWRNAILLPKV